MERVETYKCNNPTRRHKEGDVGREERLGNRHIDLNNELNDEINLTTLLAPVPLSLSLLCAHYKDGWPRTISSSQRSIL